MLQPWIQDEGSCLYHNSAIEWQNNESEDDMGSWYFVLRHTGVEGS